MAGTTMINKPFSPEETRRIVHHLQQPAVFLNMTCDWPVLRWTAEHLSSCLGDRRVRFRLGRKEKTNTQAPLFETQCSYVEASVAQFLSWTRGQSGTDVGHFSEYSSSESWAYADYKYIAMLFQDQPFMFEVVEILTTFDQMLSGHQNIMRTKNRDYSIIFYDFDLLSNFKGGGWVLCSDKSLSVKWHIKWAEFGFDGRNGRESTLWIGTEGANTPCHLDSYGCNLVLQVQGRKRWHLFPPEDTAKLYPTRIPYEESSVFSQVAVLHPDLRRFPAFRGASAHIVTLEPGQVLYVPRHWWHYVESVDPITVSVNSWIELEVDDVARVNEAVTKTVVCAIKSAQSDDNTDDWLNPTEEAVASHNENMQYLNLAVRACARRERGCRHSKLSPNLRDTQPVKRDSDGQIKKNSDGVRDCAPFGIPYGPYLIPVHCQQELRKMTPEDVEVNSSNNCAVRSQGDCAVSSDAAERSKFAAAVRLDQETHERSTGSTQCYCADGTSEHLSEHYEGSTHTTITTNDLLDCLVHPDIIARVTELLLERHTGSDRTTSSS